MDVIQVNVVGFHALEARLAGGHDMLAGNPLGVGETAHWKIALGGDHHLVAVNLGHEGTDDFL